MIERIVKNLTSPRHVNKFCSHCSFVDNGTRLDDFLVKIRILNNKLNQKYK